jgi:YidC/Oxa1 family membrane protein insertase
MIKNEPHMDRETLIGIAVCILLLVGWQLYVWKTQPVKPPPPDAVAAVPAVPGQHGVATSPTPVEPMPTAPAASPEIVPVPPAAVDPAAIAVAALPDVPPEHLENDVCRVAIDLNLGQVDGVTLKRHLKADMSAPVVLGEASADGTGPLAIAGKEPWQVLNREILAQTERRVSLRRELLRVSDHARFFLVQTWELGDDYRLRYEVSLENPGSDDLNFSELQIHAGGIGPITLVSGDKVFQETQSIVYCLQEAKDYVKHRKVDRPAFYASWFGGAEAKVPHGFTEVQENPVRWIGAANKYFTCLLIPEDGFPGGNMLFAEPLSTPPETKPQEPPFWVGASGLEKDIAIAPGRAWTETFTWYAGPQEIARLRDLAPATTQIMRLSWGSWLSWISRQLAVALIWLKDWCGSYGLGIILLTVIVKVVFWPATHRANLSMRKMQTIQPMIKELRAKYAKDQQKLSAETMKLYREHGVNPFGGCLPILLQMPVFFALYGTLTGAIELRHAGFLWIRDLTLPDTVGHLPLGFADVPINPLMLAWGGSMFLQQKLTPSAADPAQQKMMLFMPLIMTVMFYNAFPGGLTLYWTVSQAISIAQLLHQQRQRPDDPPAPGKTLPVGKKPRAATP